MKRAKPAVPFGANYRLIDIPVSNCLNSSISKIYVLTQFNSASLNRHVSRAYGSNAGMFANKGFVEALAAQRTRNKPSWFQVLLAVGINMHLCLTILYHSIDAFSVTAPPHHFIAYIRGEKFRSTSKFVELCKKLVLAGDHLYRMDYCGFIAAHREADADITVAAVPTDERHATAFGLMKIDDEGRVIEFAEKP